MELYEQVLQVIYEAISEVNQTLDSHQALERSPDTVLIGDGKLDSLGLLNFAIVVEEKIERAFHKAISIIDAALLADESNLLTVTVLANRIVGMVNRVASAEQRAQT